MPDQTVIIGAREFRIGATYGPRNGKGKPRRLTGVVREVVPFGRVWDTTYSTKSGSEVRRHGCLAVVWLRWAGEELPDA